MIMAGKGMPDQRISLLHQDISTTHQITFLAGSAQGTGLTLKVHESQAGNCLKRASSKQNAPTHSLHSTPLFNGKREQVL